MFLQARTAHQAGRIDDAEKIYRELLSIAPGHPDVLHFLGILCSQKGAHDEALALISCAIDTVPGDARFRHNLGMVFMQLKRWEDAASAFERSLAIEYENAEAEFNLGLALTKRGNLGRAAEAFRRAITVKPDHAFAMAELASCLGRTGKSIEAIELQERAIELEPRIANFRSHMGTLRLKQHDWKRAIDAFDVALGLEPWHVGSLANKGVALFEAHRDSDARRLIDLDGLIEISALQLPPNTDPAVLAEALSGHDSCVWQRSDTTTREGAQTANLFTDTGEVVQNFVSALTSRVEAFVKSRVSDKTHPFLARIPAKWTYSIWATILYQNGHQAPHLHPAGWLSGVYYLEVPEHVLSAENEDQKGWIEFGAPGYGIEPVRPPVVKRIRPEVGNLVLFPSYFFHRTIPLAGDERRISIAFDLIPSSWREA